jgi:NAD(P)-dependent dehydrogenase (short-subunit alcohol dehydrogenase family)
MQYSNALVTGASRGLGFELVRQLKDKFETVFASYRNKQTASRLTKYAKDNESIELVELDVENDKSIKSAMEFVSSRVQSLDLLINNAGIELDPELPWVDFEREDFFKNFDVNVCGPNMVVKTFLPLLVKSNEARIFNISSGMGSISRAEDDSAVYRVSKAGLNMLTAVQAGALKRHGITVVSISPGWVRTDMGGENARLSPEESVREIVKLVEKLDLSDSGKFLDFDGEPIPY